MSERLDRIELTGVRAHGRHGVLASEREQGQVFSVDVVIWLPLAPAAASDNLALSVDYAMVADGVHAIVAGEPVQLIETLAERVANFVLGFEPVREVEVAVHKPAAPIRVPFDDVVVRIHRVKAA